MNESICIVPSCYHLFSLTDWYSEPKNMPKLSCVCGLSDPLGHLTKINLPTLKCLILNFLYRNH